LRTEKYATTEATRSIAECTASVMIATDPVMTPATTFRTISVVLETIEIQAARCLRSPCGRVSATVVMARAS
jgi:hypothetical protein